MIALDKLKVGFLYETREKDGHLIHGLAIYKGNGEFWTSEYDLDGNGRPDYSSGKKLRCGPESPLKEIGPVTWKSDEELIDWLNEYHASPRIERAMLIKFEADYRWKSSTVIDLCRIMHDEKDYYRLPILGDALMDAGCDDEALIAACQNEKNLAYAQRIVALVLGGELARAVEWLEEFGSKWNFSYEDMVTPGYGDGLTAMGRDIHSAGELEPGDEESYWQCVKLLTGSDAARGDFYWSCSC